MTTVVTRQAWKTIGGLHIQPCQWSDPDANRFSLQFIGRAYPEATIDFNTAFEAETVERAMYRVFEAGKQSAKSELRAWLGTKEPK